jgi:signal transduction histidine kinase
MASPNKQPRFAPITGAMLFFVFLVTQVAAQPPADSLAALLPKMDEKQRAAFINEHFYTFYSNDFDLALALGAEALKLSRKHGDAPSEALALKNLGVVHYLKGDYEKALAHYQQAQTLYESLQDPVGQGETLREMANYFKKIGQHDQALAQLEKAIQLCTAAKDTNCLAASLDIQGVVYLELGKLDEAEANFTKEKALLERSGNETGLGYNLNNLAEVAAQRGLFEQAIQLINQSTDIRLRNKDAQGVAININNIGEILLKNERPLEALPFFEDALEKSSLLNFNDLRRHVMQMLSDTYLALGNHEKAVRWLQNSYALKDSLFNVERSRQLAEMATKYETERKEKELAQKEAQLQRRNTILAVSFLGSGILAAVFGFVFRQQKMKQQQLQREAQLQAELASSAASNRLQEERLRISRDLHDNLGAELTIIGSTLSRKAFQAGSDAEKKELEAISSSARQAMGMLRETIWAIRHEQFSVKQLAEKIGDFAMRATTVPIEINTQESPPPLSPSQTLNLYRIAQEAITNAAKYAGASIIRVAMENTPPGQLKLTITDDGKGFDPAASFAGNGLANMQARAAEMGGSLKLDTGENKGTVIEACIPI